MSDFPFAYTLASGRVWHERRKPVGHKFEYAAAYLLLDIDAKELTPWLATQGKSWLSWNAQEYLRGGNAPLRERLIQEVSDAISIQKETRILLLTLPRFLGYAFRPVSFYLLENDGKIETMVAEVNNTFGERHLYAIQREDWKDSEHGFRESIQSKNFHVSPFNSVDGQYQFRMRANSRGIHIQIHLWRDGDVIFRSGLELNKLEPWSRASVFRALWTMPLAWLGTTTRILWHAIRLFVIKRLPAVDKPDPQSPRTIYRGPQILIQRLLFPKF